MASTLLRKMAAFFGRNPKRARRAPSPTLSGSTRSSLGSSSSSSGSRVLHRLKSWYERVKARALEGYFTLEVGPDKLRYKVPIAYLSHEHLQSLLEDSVAEFGWTSSGPLHLACEEDELLEVLETVRISLEHGQTMETESEAPYQRLIPAKPN